MAAEMMYNVKSTSEVKAGPSALKELAYVTAKIKQEYSLAQEGLDYDLVGGKMLRKLETGEKDFDDERLWAAGNPRTEEDYPVHLERCDGDGRSRMGISSSKRCKAEESDDDDDDDDFGEIVCGRKIKIEKY